MLAAAWWGFVGGSALLLGAAVGVLWSVPVRVLGLILGFGAGVLFSAVAFELTADAYAASGAVPLVAEGRSNRDIGKQLFISAKTVSVHVSNILAKLAAGGRAWRRPPG